MMEYEAIQEYVFKYTVVRYGLREIQNIAKLKGHKRVNRIQRILQETRLLSNVQWSRKDSIKAEELRIRGNDFYKQNKLKEALNLYTKSLFTAPSDSPEYYLALSNRSAVLVHQSHYSLALEDAQTALKLIKNHPVQKKLEDKLKNRIQTCEKRVQQNKDNEEPETCTSEQKKQFQLRDQRHPKIPCASDKLKLLYDDKFGRKVVAASDLKPGNVIAVEKPFCHVINRDEHLIRCAQCSLSCIVLHPCPGCTKIGFCSKECLSASKWHKYECPMRDCLDNMMFPQMLLTRMITTVRSDFQDWRDLKKLCNEEETKLTTGDVEITQSYRSIYRLYTDENRRSETDLFLLGLGAAVFNHLLKVKTEFFADLWIGKECEKFTAELILRNISFIPVNAYAIYMYEDKNNSMNIASGVYPFLSMFNHSCCPNTDLYDFGIFKVLKVIQPIKKGEQIFVDYGLHYAIDSKNRRQKELNSRYNFTCECGACSEDWPKFVPHLDFFENSSTKWSKDDFVKLFMGDLITAQKMLDPLYKNADRIENLPPSDDMRFTYGCIKMCMFIIARTFESKYIEE